MSPSPDYYGARRERLRRELAARDLDGALVYSWRRGAVPWLTGYFPGFETNTATLWQPADGAPRMGVRFGHERPRASAVSGLEVATVAEPATLVADGARRIGLIGGDFAIDELPVSVLRALDASGVEAIRLDGLLDDWRAIKDEGEIERLARAAAVCDASLRTLPRGPAGLRDHEIAALVEGEARRLGASRALCLVGLGADACITEPHGRAASEGDDVGLELTLHVDGACGHACHTIPAGDAFDRADARACARARAAIIAALRPGATVDSAVEAGDGVLARAGLLGAKEYDFGHGVGMGTPEHPRLVAGTGREIAAGMVIAVHVGVRSPSATWTAGGPVAIGADGARELAPDALWTQIADARTT